MVVETNPHPLEGVGGGGGGVVSSGEGRFILDYLGTAMMDSRCMYSREMMPWVIAEILRFSGVIQVVLSVKGGRLMCTSLKNGQVIWDSAVGDCVHSFLVEVDLVGPERKGFVVILRANDIYLHCRLFAASSTPQVSEVFSTMKESLKEGEGGGGGRSATSASAPRLHHSPIAPDSISFEVLYVGKLRMSYRKAPANFIDEALAKFRAHENEMGRRDSVLSSLEYSSTGSSSRESTMSPRSSAESLGGAVTAPIQPSLTRPSFAFNISEEPDSGQRSSTPRSTPGRDMSPEARTNSSSVPDLPLVKATIPHPLEDVGVGRITERCRNPSGDSLLVKSMSLPVDVSPMRNRALSTGNYPREQVLETNRIGPGQYNRTMILIVGRCEMKIISPDKKTLLFSKHFRDIYQSSQGLENKEYFGFICKEAQGGGGGVPGRSSAGGGGYIAFVFRCQSDSVALDILKVLKQASLASLGQDSTKLQSCDHCPMVWYRQLCAEVDGVNSDERIQFVILKHMHTLCDQDRASILQKFHGAEGQSLQEQNELLMMLLRVHCEAKQVKHIHDTAENRHEFLNQFLGGGEIFTKAKRSLDHFIKRKSLNRPEVGLNPPLSPLVSLGEDASMATPSPGSTSTNNSTPGGRESPQISDSPLEDVRGGRQRSSTIGALTGEKIRFDLRARRTSTSTTTTATSPMPQNQNSSFGFNIGKGAVIGGGAAVAVGGSSSPMINLFHKMGSSSQNKTSTSASSTPSQRPPGSWRHAIFKKVVSPSTISATPPSGSLGSRHGHVHGHSHNHSLYSSSSAAKTLFHPKRSQDEIRELWKTAINQQIILIRMEKQNLRLKAKQEEADVKRLKLSYRDLGVCDEESTETWDLIMASAMSTTSTEGGPGTMIKVDEQLLSSAILRGIPKTKRGQIWQFFIEQKKLASNYTPAGNQTGRYGHLKLDMTYEQLLRQLTSQQHAILIDLGRTFPTHPYFSGALGSGQLALFNILKAYSLLDTDVGYCQGLSFVAGMLLMHLEEEEAFQVLKYIMFDLGAREHYKPDMHELQVKLYQLTRLIHDQDADLLLLLNHYDVLPSLYAAPWFLTLFASQFPIGFAVRVLDLLLLHGVDIIAKFALVLILDHKSELMQCTGLEAVMDCFKSVVTNISSSKLDRYLKRVIESDFDKQLLTYCVEYSVMNDEAFHAFMSDSSASSSLSLKGDKSKGVDRGVQTPAEFSKSFSNGSATGSMSLPPGQGLTSTGEKHPIFGDLIQRQNTEIARLQKDKFDLRRDVQSLLNCILTMQKLAQISTGGQLSLPVPPEVTELGSKYFMKCGTNYAKLLEDPSISIHANANNAHNQNHGNNKKNSQSKV